MEWTQQINWVDCVFIAFVLCGGILGVLRGLSHELATLIGILVAVLVTRLGYEPLANWVCDRLAWNPEITRLLAVVLLVVLALYGMRLLRLALSHLMTFAFKGAVERLGGLLAGAFRWGVLALLLMLAAYFIPSASVQRPVQSSVIGDLLLPHLVAGYNALAEKARMIEAEVPVGVELPQLIMPPPVEGDAPDGQTYPTPPIAYEE